MIQIHAPQAYEVKPIHDHTGAPLRLDESRPVVWLAYLRAPDGRYWCRPDTAATTPDAAIVCTTIEFVYHDYAARIFQSLPVQSWPEYVKRRDNWALCPVYAPYPGEEPQCADCNRCDFFGDAEVPICNRPPRLAQETVYTVVYGQSAEQRKDHTQ